MAAHFKTYGPYKVGNSSSPLEKKELRDFWSRVDEPIALSIGIYILLVGENKELSPIYVGKAEHGFRSRLKANHDAFRKAKNEYPNQILSFLFLSRVSAVKGKFSRKRKGDESLKSIQDLEVLLIRDCLLRGIKLLNTAEKVFFENLVVPGYLHDEGMKQDLASRCLNKLIRAKKPVRVKDKLGAESYGSTGR